MPVFRKRPLRQSTDTAGSAQASAAADKALQSQKKRDGKTASGARNARQSGGRSNTGKGAERVIKRSPSVSSDNSEFEVVDRDNTRSSDEEVITTVELERSSSTDSWTVEQACVEIEDIGSDLEADRSEQNNGNWFIVNEIQRIFDQHGIHNEVSDDEEYIASDGEDDCISISSLTSSDKAAEHLLPAHFDDDNHSVKHKTAFFIDPACDPDDCENQHIDYEAPYDIATYLLPRRRRNALCGADASIAPRTYDIDTSYHTANERSPTPSSVASISSDEDDDEDEDEEVLNVEEVGEQYSKEDELMIAPVRLIHYKLLEECTDNEFTYADEHTVDKETQTEEDNDPKGERTLTPVEEVIVKDQYTAYVCEKPEEISERVVREHSVASIETAEEASDYHFKVETAEEAIEQDQQVSLFDEVDERAKIVDELHQMRQDSEEELLVPLYQVTHTNEHNWEAETPARQNEAMRQIIRPHHDELDELLNDSLALQDILISYLDNLPLCSRRKTNKNKRRKRGMKNKKQETNAEKKKYIRMLEKSQGKRIKNKSNNKFANITLPTVFRLTSLRFDAPLSQRICRVIIQDACELSVEADRHLCQVLAASAGVEHEIGFYRLQNGGINHRPLVIEATTENDATKIRYTFNSKRFKDACKHDFSFALLDDMVHTVMDLSPLEMEHFDMAYVQLQREKELYYEESEKSVNALGVPLLLSEYRKWCAAMNERFHDHYIVSVDKQQLHQLSKVNNTNKKRHSAAAAHKH